MDSPDSQPLKERIQQAIEQPGMGRSKFAASAGVGTSVVGKWIKGTLEPKSRQLLKIAQICGVSMEWLLTGEDGQAPASSPPSKETNAEALELLATLERRAKAVQDDLARLRRLMR